MKATYQTEDDFPTGMLAGPGEPRPRPFWEIPRLWFRVTQFTDVFFAQEAFRASGSSTLIGVMLCGATLSLLSVLSSQLYGATRGMLGIDASDTGAQALLCGYIVTGLLAFFYLDNALIYLGARIQRGTGRFVSQVYLMSLFVVPLAMAEGLVVLVPSAHHLPTGMPLALGLYAVILSVYRILLAVRTVRVVHQLSTNEAFFAVMWLRLLLFVPLSCAAIVLIGRSA